MQSVDGGGDCFDGLPRGQLDEPDGMPRDALGQVDEMYLPSHATSMESLASTVPSAPPPPPPSALMKTISRISQRSFKDF